MTDIYTSPLSERYAGRAMQEIFSEDEKFSTWRRLWIALAESEKELGLPITDAQISQMKEHINDIDYAKAAEYEGKLRHDVMAHIRTFGEACPDAEPIIHLGATSCFVGDNADMIIMRKALLQTKSQLVGAIDALCTFAEKHKDEPTLAYTHFQAAQPTTVGKRSTLWAQDLLFDLERLDSIIESLPFPGCKGTTGSAASFLSLFGGDAEKAMKLEKLIAEKMGFAKCIPVSGQTYTRKLDYNILSVLSGIAQSASKFATDIRLLSHLKEFDEPFEAKQVGSSAMAYKRNPMRCERICSLSRYVMIDALNPAVTAATQWLERTLDDSANRRISLPEAFLAVDGILTLYTNVVSNGTVYPNVAKKHLEEELPYMATENILMYCTKKGGDRQALHEAIRELSVQVTKEIKQHGRENNLLALILEDERFNLTKEELDSIVKAENFVGLAPIQTEMFLENYARPAVEANRSFLKTADDVRI